MKTRDLAPPRELPGERGRQPFNQHLHKDGTERDGAEGREGEVKDAMGACNKTTRHPAHPQGWAAAGRKAKEGQTRLQTGSAGKGV